MEIRQLKYFLETAKYKSVTKAAESLHISQPALSKMMKSLEEELGLPLIIRTNKTSDLTDAGTVVLEYAQKMTALLEEMKLLIHHDHPLAAREVIELHELRDEEFIFYNEEFALHQIMRNQCINQGFEPKILFKTSQWDLMSEMVAAQLGVTVLPQSICERVMNPDIKIIKLRPAILWKLAVITKKERYLSFASQTLINFFLNERQFFHHNQ